MTTTEPVPFIDYWNAVDDAMLKFFGIDTCDAGIEADRIASAQEEGDTPEDFALWLGENTDSPSIQNGDASLATLIAGGVTHPVNLRELVGYFPIPLPRQSHSGMLARWP